MTRRPSSPEGKCRDCGSLVFWAAMPNGKKLPLDREPTRDGKIVLFKRPDGSLRGEYLRRGEAPRAPARTCHFDTCRERRRGRNGATHERAVGASLTGAFGKVVRVQVIVEYENGTVLRFRPQPPSEAGAPVSRAEVHHG